MSRNLFFFTAAILLGSSRLFAQQEDSSFSQLDEVVVTATKFPKKVSESGKVVTIIDRNVLERSIGKDLAQVLTEQPGIVINGAMSNPGKDKSVFIRGAKNDYTVILIDGIVVTDPTGVGGAFDLRMIPVDQVERVEILKGAQSTLYGSDAIAGVINIITKKGAGKPVELAGNASVGSYGSRKLYVGLNGKANKISYHTGFTHNASKGLSEAKDTTALKTFDKDGAFQNAFQLNIDGEVLNGLHIKPFFRYTFFKSDYDNGAFADAANTYKSDLFSTGAIAQWKFTKGFINAQYSYDKVNRRYNSSFGSSKFVGENNFSEVFGQYQLNEKLQFLGGIDHRLQQVRDTSARPKNPSIRMTSPYISMYFQNPGGFNLETGVRYNKHSKYGDNLTYSVNPSYLINSKIKLFANVASAFKAPPIATLYGKYGANPDLKPERSQTYEAGVQADFIKNLLGTRVVYFQRNIKDVVIYGPSFTYINLDRQNDYGIEAESSVRVNENLQIKAFYTYTRGKVTTLSKTSNKDTSYNNLIRKPNHTYGLNIGYQVTRDFYVSTNVYHYGKRDDLFFNLSSFKQQPVTLQGYTIWNAYAEYGLAKNYLKLFADLRNITNTRYDEIYGYSTLGFTVNGGISFRF